MSQRFFGFGAFLFLLATSSAASNHNEAAAEVADAIQSGDSDRQRELLPLLNEIEFTELGKLAGCDTQLRTQDAGLSVYIDWSCDENTAAPGLARTTGMFFAASGELIGFSVNRPAQAFVPTQTSIAVAEMPAARELLSDFGQAIVGEGDISLGGIVGLDEFDRARLAPYTGGEFMVANWQVDGQYVIYLTNPGQTDRRLAATLQIDEDGRPTGLDILPAYDRSNVASLNARRNDRRGRDDRRVRRWRGDLRDTPLTSPRSELARDPSRAICKNC